jgi:hypothetical protein
MRRAALNMQLGIAALDLNLGDIALADQPQQLAHRVQAKLVVERWLSPFVLVLGHDYRSP